jgi:hypothetical protein
MSRGPLAAWMGRPAVGIPSFPRSLLVTGGRPGVGHPLIFSGGAGFRAQAGACAFLKGGQLYPPP